MNELIEAIKGYTEHPSEYTRELTELAQVLDNDFRTALARYYELISIIKGGGYYFSDHSYTRTVQVNDMYNTANNAKMKLASIYENKEILSEEFQELIVSLYFEVKFVCDTVQEILRQHFASLREELRKELDK